MAIFYKHISSELFVVSRNVFGSVCSNAVQIQGVRCLYSPAALGVDGYLKSRERVSLQFQNIADKFRSKMIDYTEKSDSNMIFTEDLKNMVHLAESSKNDIDLVMRMVRRFNQQNRNLRFGNFIFGPVVMRMFYHLNTAEAAYKAFKDPELEGFFDQIASYQILMDLLFKNEKYTEVLDVFEIIKEKRLEGAKYPKHSVVLAFAAMYKMNTPESFNLARQLWGELLAVGHIPMRRAVALAAALAINQNSPHDALEMLSGIRQQSYVSIRNLKVAALADIGRPEDAFPLLRAILESDHPHMKFTVAKSSLDKMRAAIAKQKKEDIQMEYEHLEKRLLAGEHVTEKPENDWLLNEIQRYTKNLDQDDDRRYLAASFNRQRQGPAPRRMGDVYRPRPGLANMS